jgi:hypothetical protein
LTVDKKPGKNKSKPSGLLTWLGDAYDNFYVLFALLSSAGINGLFLSFVTSVTLQRCMTVGAVIGSLFGYGYTLLSWKKGAAKKTRKTWVYIYSFLAFVCMLLGVLVLLVIDPYVVMDWPFLEPVYNLLVAPSYGADLTMFLVACAGSFFFVSAFAVMSPGFDRASNRGCV